MTFLSAVAVALVLAAPARADDAVRANLMAYRDAWLKGDADAVMATLTPDAVLLPSGLSPVVGQEAIRAFWWPVDEKPTRIDAMELDIERVSIDGALAYAWGRGTLTFTYDGRTRTTRSTFLNVLRRQADGSWQTACRMWSDRPRE